MEFYPQSTANKKESWGVLLSGLLVLLWREAKRQQAVRKQEGGIIGNQILRHFPFSWAP